MAKLKIVGKWERASLYKKSMIIFSTVLVVLGISFLIYVYKSMVLYENNLVDNYISYLASSGKLSKDISGDLFEVSKYEKKNAKITDGIKKIYKSDELVTRKNTKLSQGDLYAYDLKLNDNVITTVTFKSVDSYTRMAILKINEWEVEDIKTNFDNGIYHYEINIPANYKLYINDIEVDSKDITKEGDIEGMERLTNYIEIQKSKTYTINNLVYEPVIKILDEFSKEVKYEVKDGKITVAKDFKEYAKFDDLKKELKTDFDVLKLAENWSLFLTDDLKGGSYHGFTLLTPYLVKDSYMYEMAYNWSHNVDITFVSSHTLKNPTFTKEEVKNCVVYNENAFSCEVYLEKNMRVSGKDKVDVMHDRLYFIYYEGGYKLVDMKAIKE